MLFIILIAMTSLAVVVQCEESVCYRDLGCFNKMPLALEHLKKLPFSPWKLDTKYYLFSWPVPSEGHLIYYDYCQGTVSLPSIMKQPEKIFVQFHGYDDARDISPQFQYEDMRLALLQAVPNSIVIFVDMSEGMTSRMGVEGRYLQSVANIQVSGRVTALFLNIILEQLSLSPDSVHLIGHNLGAHAAGHAGHWFQNITNGQKLGRISGLDPAGPMFEESDDVNDFLSQEDAEYVDIIHTSAAAGSFPKSLRGELGIRKSTGHVDTYVNGGSHQPGCSGETAQSCSQERSVELFTSSISKCSFDSQHCKSYDKVKGPQDCSPCSDKPCGQMGFSSDPLTSSGIMSTTTTKKSPFC